MTVPATTCIHTSGFCWSLAGQTAVHQSSDYADSESEQSEGSDGHSPGQQSGAEDLCLEAEDAMQFCLRAGLHDALYVHQVCTVDTPSSVPLQALYQTYIPRNGTLQAQQVCARITVLELLRYYGKVPLVRVPPRRL